MSNLIKRHIRSDTIGEIVNSMPPHIYIADEFEIDEDVWVRADTAASIARSPELLKMHPEEIEAELGIWHYSQDYKESGPVIRTATGDFGDLNIPELSIASLGGSGYITFFPGDEVTVWVKSKSLLEFDSDEILSRDSNNSRILVPPDAPSGDEPYRFIGSTDRKTPFVVGPFLRTQSVWVRATAKTKFCWTTIQGSSFSSVVRVGQ
jgi:hypothetical protein